MYNNLRWLQFMVQSIYPLGRWNLPQVKNHWYGPSTFEMLYLMTWQWCHHQNWCATFSHHHLQSATPSPRKMGRVNCTLDLIGLIFVGH